MIELPSKLAVFSMGEVSFLTQISVAALREICDRRELKYHRTSPNGRRRVTRDSLMLYMRSNGIPFDLASKGTNRQATTGHERSIAPRDFISGETTHDIA